MGYTVPFGQKFESVQIGKANVAAGFPGRAIMLGPNCLIGKSVYYDERVKRAVEVDQEAIIKYHFDKVSEYYYMAIARLNTDMAGNIVSNDIKVEYVRMSGDMYNDVCTQLRENPNFTSLLLELVVKKGDNGKDFSWVSVKLSSAEIPTAIQAKVQQLVETPGAVEGVLQMIDSQTSITVAEYEKRLAELSSKAALPASQFPGAAPAPAVPAAPAPAPLPANAPVQAPKPLGAAPRVLQQAAAASAAPAPAPAPAAPTAARIEPRPATPGAAPAPAVPAAPANAFDDLAGAADDDFEDGAFADPGDGLM